jgi:hypothetical protein
MATEAISNYLHMVGGLTKTTRERAMAMARALLAQAGLEGVAADAGDRVNKLAEEILNAAHANRELLERFVAAEVDKAASRLGFARADQVESLRNELADLRRLVEEHRVGGAGFGSETGAAAGAAAKRSRPRSPAAEPPPSVGAARKTAAKKASTRKAPSTKATSARGTAGSEGLGVSSESLGSASESAENVPTSEPPEASLLANEPGGEGLGG